MIHMLPYTYEQGIRSIVVCFAARIQTLHHGDDSMFVHQAQQDQHVQC